MQTISISKHQKIQHSKDLTLTLTCQSGLESLVRRESEKLGLQHTTGQDRLVSGEGNLDTLYKLLIGSRFANRVYIELAHEQVSDFDTLHDILSSIKWSEYLTGREDIVVEASSTRSTLTSTPTIQSVGQKAIFSTLYTPNNTSGTEVHILLLIVDDTLRVLLDITGDPLHKRGYRTESGEAPIKENLAAALIAFSGWRYKEPLLDPFCGSGTIAIEAAMMARNIAPGLHRHFRIESLPFHDRTLFLKAKHELEGKIYPSGTYQIFASDRDEAMIEMAKRNAERAGVTDDIVFSVADFLDPLTEKGGLGWVTQKGILQNKTPPNLPLSREEGNEESRDVDSSQAQNDGTTKSIITNPPYGNRLESENLDAIYKKLETEVEKYGGGFITSYLLQPKHLANKKLLNGSEECRFWYKKSSK